MNIAVLVKQVPASEDVKIDPEKGTMIREGIESELNPLDLHAIEAAVAIKEARPGEDVRISVISMGPPNAGKAVTDAISMGCDYGYLLSDRTFAGADTWSTAYTLAAGIKKIGRFDLILTGERATDGETGQVGPGVGAILGFPVLTYVGKIEDLTDESVVVHRSIEGGHEVLRSPLPALISTIKELNVPRIPTLRGKIRAKTTAISVLGHEDISLDVDKAGLNGSPTRVVKVSHPQVTRRGEVFQTEGNPEKAARRIISLLETKEII